MALPLDAINAASAREKSIRHGHPSTLHLWWARRPLAACRAVLFASLVDDPSGYLPDEAEADRERQRLFRIIESLVPWEASQDDRVLNTARLEIARSLERSGAPRLGENPSEETVNKYLEKHAPPVLDPFCGGGSIPLEAQRLGLEAHGSDINPVAVLITKALIEIPPRFAGQAPVNPDARKALLKAGTHKGAQGLAADVRDYGEWMRTEAEKRIGHLYPKVKLPKEHGGGEATAIAWLWARTVKCPNPACGCEMPLVKSFVLSSKKGKETWIEPVIKRGKPPRIEFSVKTEGDGAGDGTVSRRGATCLACGGPVDLEYVRDQGKAGQMGATLMAMVAAGTRSRIYLSPTIAHAQAATVSEVAGLLETEMPAEGLGIRVPKYGLTRHRDLFAPRQLVALSTFTDLVSEAMELAKRDALSAGLADDDIPLRDGARGARAYAEAVGTYLGFAVSKLSDNASSICTWHSGGSHQKIGHTFGRQAIPMTWDFAEGNVFSESTGNFFS